MDEKYLQENERIDYLIDKRIRIIQKTQGFCFSMDAVLLANFATVKSGDRVCDLGTGTGVIPMILADRTKASQIIGLELQASMVDMARRSVVLNGMEPLVDVNLGDIKNAHLIYGSSTFDLVTANPPYMHIFNGINSLAEDIAIAKHEIKCTLEDVLRAGSRIVKSRGRMAMVHRPQRLTDIIAGMRTVRLEPKRIRFVHPRRKSPANMVLIEAIKDGGTELTVLNPLVVYNEDGQYTQELKAIYFGSGGENNDT